MTCHLPGGIRVAIVEVFSRYRRTYSRSVRGFVGTNLNRKRNDTYNQISAEERLSDLKQPRNPNAFDNFGLEVRKRGRT